MCIGLPVFDGHGRHCIQVFLGLDNGNGIAGDIGGVNGQSAVFHHVELVAVVKIGQFIGGGIVIDHHFFALDLIAVLVHIVDSDGHLTVNDDLVDHIVDGHISFAAGFTGKSNGCAIGNPVVYQAVESPVGAAVIPVPVTACISAFVTHIVQVLIALANGKCAVTIVMDGQVGHRTVQIGGIAANGHILAGAVGKLIVCALEGNGPGSAVYIGSTGNLHDTGGAPGGCISGSIAQRVSASGVFNHIPFTGNEIAEGIHSLQGDRLVGYPVELPVGAAVIQHPVAACVLALCGRIVQILTALADGKGCIAVVMDGQCGLGSGQVSSIRFGDGNVSVIIDIEVIAIAGNNPGSTVYTVLILCGILCLGQNVFATASCNHIVQVLAASGVDQNILFTGNNIAEGIHLYQLLGSVRNAHLDAHGGNTCGGGGKGLAGQINTAEKFAVGFTDSQLHQLVMGDLDQANHGKGGNGKGILAIGIGAHYLDGSTVFHIETGDSVGIPAGGNSQADFAPVGILLVTHIGGDIPCSHSVRTGQARDLGCGNSGSLRAGQLITGHGASIACGNVLHPVPGLRNGAVHIKAAGNHFRADGCSVLALHLRSHGAQYQPDVGCDLGFRLKVGIVAPDTEHAAGRVCNGAAHEAAVGPVACFRIQGRIVGGVAGTGSPAVILTGNIVVVTVDVDHLMAQLCHSGGRCGLVAIPAGGPEGHCDVLVKIVGGSIIEIDAVVEDNGGHVIALDQRRHLINVIDKQLILALVYQSAKAHGTAGISVVCIFVRAKVEFGAALTAKVGNVLFHQALGKINRSGVFQIHGGGRAVKACTAAGQGAGSRYDGIHMSGVIQQGEDLDAHSVGMGNNRIHLRFRQFVGTEIVIVSVALLNRSSNLGIGIGAHGHIIQQESQTVVTKGQFQMGITGGGHLIDQSNDPVLGKILAAAVQMQDAVETRIRNRRGLIR